MRPGRTGSGPAGAAVRPAGPASDGLDPGLEAAVRSLGPLLEVLPRPQYFRPVTMLGAAAFEAYREELAEHAARWGVPAPVPSPDPPAEQGVFGGVVARRLAMQLPFPEAALEHMAVEGIDGTPLRAYRAGAADAPAVLLVAPCGMPVELVAGWVGHLSARHRVLTWETSGLFGGDAERAGLAEAYLAGSVRDRVDAQTSDLIAVIEAAGAGDVHVIGLCGGAVLALAAAAQRPDLVRSLSLWHADLLVRKPGCRSVHQTNLTAVLEIAGRDLATAASVHDVLLRSLLDSVPPDLAHLVLHPYATAELFHRYGRINGAIMGLDAAELVDRVRQPVLVVTSADDATAHPAASHEVAAALSDAELVVLDHGDHIALFRGSPSLFDLATGFIRRH